MLTYIIACPLLLNGVGNIKTALFLICPTLFLSQRVGGAENLNFAIYMVAIRPLVGYSGSTTLLACGYVKCASTSATIS